VVIDDRETMGKRWAKNSQKMVKQWSKIVKILILLLALVGGVSFGQNEHRPVSSSDARRMENELRRIWFWLAHWDVRSSAPRDRDGKAGEHFLYVHGSTVRIYFHDGSVWKYIDVSNSTFSNYLLKTELTDSLNARAFYSATDTVSTLATQYDLTQLASADSDWVRISVDSLWFTVNSSMIWRDGSGNLSFKDANAGTVTLNNILRRDGTLGLTGNWDAGNYEVRAQTFNSDVATGTAPFTVASQTKVTSLNADYLDDYNSTHWISLNEPIVTTASTPASNAERVLTAGSGITVTDGGANTTVTVAADLAGDATAGRVLRMVQLQISDGTNANTIKVETTTGNGNGWNGLNSGSVDNLGKGATSGVFSLDVNGQGLSINVTGNAIAAFGSIESVNVSDLYAWARTYSNNAQIFLKQQTITLDMTSFVDSITAAIYVALFYITDQ